MRSAAGSGPSGRSASGCASGSPARSSASGSSPRGPAGEGYLGPTGGDVWLKGLGLACPYGYFGVLQGILLSIQLFFTLSKF